MLHDTNASLQSKEAVGLPSSPADSGDHFISMTEEFIVPEQFFTRAGESAAYWTGERRLLLAVLQDAVDSFLRHRTASSRRGKRLFREDREWFWAKDRDAPCSFENICGHLGLDPDYIRLGLKRALQETPNPVPVPQRKASHPVRHLSLIPGSEGEARSDQPASQNAYDELVREVAA